MQPPAAERLEYDELLHLVGEAQIARHRHPNERDDARAPPSSSSIRILASGGRRAASRNVRSSSTRVATGLKSSPRQVATNAASSGETGVTNSRNASATSSTLAQSGLTRPRPYQRNSAWAAPTDAMLRAPVGRAHLVLLARPSELRSGSTPHRPHLGLVGLARDGPFRHRREVTAKRKSERVRHVGAAAR